MPRPEDPPAGGPDRAGAPVPGDGGAGGPDDTRARKAADDAGPDRWYERIVRRAPRLRPDEERTLVATIEAYRVVVAVDVLGSKVGLAYLRELGTKLATGTLDVRNVIEMEADIRVADARAECLEQLARVARLAEHPTRRPGADLVAAIRDLPLRRPHVDAVLTRMEAVRAKTHDALLRVGAAADAAAKARTRLVEAHLRLVVAIARRWGGQGLELPDLVQEGTIGLMRAIDRFDSRREVSFATYAAWWVRQTMGRGVAQRARPVRLPLSVEEGIRKVRKHRRRVAARSGEVATSQEIAAGTSLSVRRVDDLCRIERELCQPAMPFDDVSPDDPDGRSWADVLADRSRPGPEEAAIARRLHAHARLALRSLTPREREVLGLRYGLDRQGDHTLEDIGRKFGLTRQRILQITTKALEKLRACTQTCPLRSFWES